MLNLYALKLPSEDDWAYDCFEGAVVAAANVKQAREVASWFGASCTDCDWSRMRVRRVGITHYRKPRIILAAHTGG